MEGDMTGRTQTSGAQGHISSTDAISLKTGQKCPKGEKAGMTGQLLQKSPGIMRYGSESEKLAPSAFASRNQQTFEFRSAKYLF